MPLTPEEQKELKTLEAEEAASKATPTPLREDLGKLTPEEQKEYLQLEEEEYAAGGKPEEAYKTPGQKALTFAENAAEIPSLGYMPQAVGIGSTLKDYLTGKRSTSALKDNLTSNAPFGSSVPPGASPDDAAVSGLLPGYQENKDNYLKEAARRSSANFGVAATGQGIGAILGIAGPAIEETLAQKGYPIAARAMGMASFPSKIADAAGSIIPGKGIARSAARGAMGGGAVGALYNPGDTYGESGAQVIPRLKNTIFGSLVGGGFGASSGYAQKNIPLANDVENYQKSYPLEREANQELQKASEYLTGPGGRGGKIGAIEQEAVQPQIDKMHADIDPEWLKGHKYVDETGKVVTLDKEHQDLMSRLTHGVLGGENGTKYTVRVGGKEGLQIARKLSKVAGYSNPSAMEGEAAVGNPQAAGYDANIRNQLKAQGMTGTEQQAALYKILNSIEGTQAEKNPLGFIKSASSAATPQRGAVETLADEHNYPGLKNLADRVERAKGYVDESGIPTSYRGIKIAIKKAAVLGPARTARWAQSNPNNPLLAPNYSSTAPLPLMEIIRQLNTGEKK